MLLQNDKITLSMNERGEIEALSMAGGRNIIARPTGLFRAVLHKGDNWECTAVARDQQLRVEADGDTLRLTVDALQTSEGSLPVSIRMQVKLEEDRLRFSAELENHSDAVVDEWIYPRVGVIEDMEGQQPDLLYPFHMGERIADIGAYLQGLTDRTVLHEVTGTYPGYLSMQWMLLEAGKTCLYLTGRDQKLHVTSLRAKGSEQGGVTLEMNKMSFVRPGETWVCPDYIARLYHGNWMESAREYAAWAATWRKHSQPKEWMRRMNGYFLVINKQQYGDEIWPYDTIPELYDHAQAHGFDTLGLFGWYHTGHDNGYPDLEVSPTMGGAEKLKEGIRAVHAKGGHVTLYYQGHLMDVGSRFYKEKGCHLEGKTRWGTSYYEYYDKYCASDYLHFFSKKPFATICPSCAEWHDLMAQRADWVYGFGADGILYDQIGGMPPYPCFDESHRHMENRPSLSHTQGRMKLHQRIRAQVDTHENFAYMTEHVTDAHSTYPDCLHGIGSHPDAKPADQQKGPGPRLMPELFRYTFPETMITIRNPKPYVRQRDANYALTYGFKLEMELRFATDRELIRAGEHAEERDYVAKLAALRRRFEDYLLLGTFKGQEGLQEIVPGVKAGLFVRADGKTAAVLWNDTANAQPVRLAEAHAWNAWASAAGEGDGIPAEIASQQVLFLYEK